ncbi:hypothetical protein GRAN_2500 [Granulicella sibirica]|uniref:Uncharacterized protein n=1 Tax=Granulicella sibirica TaxID=2479048 RepID=A0A4Q0SX14_9BACT|nr:hypothetical protein GRAN_2500 [Granulicella sibirica]
MRAPVRILLARGAGRPHTSFVQLNGSLDKTLEKVEADHTEIAENLAQMRNRNSASLPGN